MPGHWVFLTIKDSCKLKKEDEMPSLLQCIQKEYCSQVAPQQSLCIIPLSDTKIKHFKSIT